MTRSKGAHGVTVTRETGANTATPRKRFTGFTTMPEVVATTRVKVVNGGFTTGSPKRLGGSPFAYASPDPG